VTAISGSTAAITGAGSGIGRATALALARRGARLALADVNEAGLAETARLARSHLCDDDHVSTHVSTCRADIGATRRRALPTAAPHPVNNAGVTSAGPFEEESLEDLHWIVDVNVWGVVYGCHAFLPVLRQADEAHIVNLSSMAGLLGTANVIYSMSKGAVRTFSRPAAELRSSGIGVTMVHPRSATSRRPPGERGRATAAARRLLQARARPDRGASARGGAGDVRHRTRPGTVPC
jgi:NAD(P)-dependent dehydrogenase (short-subunit alcohol dehydrogenase family)